MDEVGIKGNEDELDQDENSPGAATPDVLADGLMDPLAAKAPNNEASKPTDDPALTPLTTGPLGKFTDGKPDDNTDDSEDNKTPDAVTQDPVGSQTAQGAPNGGPSSPDDVPMAKGVANSKSGLRTLVLDFEGEEHARVRFLPFRVSDDLRIRSGEGRVRLNKKGFIVEVLSFNGAAEWLRNSSCVATVHVTSLAGRPRRLMGAGNFQLTDRIALNTRRGVDISMPEGQTGNLTLRRARVATVSAVVAGNSIQVDLLGGGASDPTADAEAPGVPADRKALKEAADGNKGMAITNVEELKDGYANADFLPSKVPWRRMWVLEGHGRVQLNRKGRVDNVVDAQMKLTWMHRRKTQGVLDLTGVSGKPRKLSGQGSFTTTRAMTLPGKKGPKITLGPDSVLDAEVVKGKLDKLIGPDVELTNVEDMPMPPEEPMPDVSGIPVAEDGEGGPVWKDLNPEFYPTRNLIYQSGRALCNVKKGTDKVTDILIGYGTANWRTKGGHFESVRFEDLYGNPKKASLSGATTLTQDMGVGSGGGLDLTARAGSPPLTLEVTDSDPTVLAGRDFSIAANANGSELYDLSTTGQVAVGKGNQVDGTADVTFSRRPAPITTGRGPANDWDVWLEPPTQALPTARITNSELSELTGAIELSVTKGSLKVFTVAGNNASYGPHDAPVVSVMGADLTMLNTVDLVTFDTIRLGLGLGTGGTISLADNDITELGGTLPFYLDNATGRYLDGVLAGKYSGGVFNGSGTMNLMQNQALGGKSGEDGWTVGLLQSTGLTAVIVNNGLSSMSGTLNMAVAQGEAMWAKLTTEGSYEHATRNINGTAAIDVMADIKLFSHKGLDYFIGTGSNSNVTVTDSSLVRFEAGLVKLLVHEGGTLWVSGGVKDVVYDRPAEDLSGTIFGEVHKDVTRGMTSKGDPNTVLVHKGSKADVKMTNSAFDRMDVTNAAVSVHVEKAGEGPADVKGTLAGGLSQKDDGLLLEKLEGSINLKEDWQAHKRVRLLKDSGVDDFKAANNAVTYVEGNIGAVVADEAGVDFAEGHIQGSWSADTGLVNGSLTGKLLQDVTQTLGGDLSVTLHKDAEGSVVVKDSAISTISGKAIRATLYRGTEALFDTAVEGEYDVTNNILKSLKVDASLLTTFGFFQDRMHLTGANASIEIKDNALIKAHGDATVESETMMIRKASVSFDWAVDAAGTETFHFVGDADWVAWQDSQSSLKGAVHIDYKSLDEFSFLGTAHYKMTDGALAAGMSLAFDQDLSPTIGGYLKYATTLMDGSKLFDMEWGIDMPLVSVAVATVWFGTEISIGLDTLPLTFDGGATIAGWRPFEQNTPDFSMTAGATWGLTFRARVAAHLEAGLQLLIAGAGIGAEAGLGMEMPLTLAPTLYIDGDKDGWGGSIGIDIGLSATAIFDASLYYYANLVMGWLGEYEGTFLDTKLEFPLFDEQWGADFEFGDKKPKKKSPRTKVDGVPPMTAEQKKLSKGDLPSHGSKVPTSKGETVTDKAEKPQLPGKKGDKVDMGDAFGGKESKSESVFPDSFDQWFKGGDVAAMWDAFEAAERFWDRLGMFFDILLNPATGIVRFAREWFKEDGMFSGSSLKKDYEALEKGLEAAGNLISGLSANSWDTWYRVGQVIAGKMSLWEAYMGSDDAVMEAINGGAYKKMSDDDLQSMIEILCAGDTACVGEKEWGVVKIIRVADKRGAASVRKVIRNASGTYTGANQVLWKLEGSTDAEVTKIFNKHGIDWSYL